MSAAVTSSMTWCAFKPLIAANMLRIIGASLPCSMRPPREVRPLVGLPCLWPCRLGDDRRVDVGEHVVLHVIAIDRRDDGAIADRDDERRLVHEDHRLARALAGGAVDALAESSERRLPELDPAALDALDRVARELDALSLLAQHVAERRTLRRRRLGRLRGRLVQRRRQRPGRDDRRVVRQRAHLTCVTAPASMPPAEPIVSVALPSLPTSTWVTVPLWGLPSASA